MPGVYAYSVDDAVGNLNVEAQGYIVDIGSTKHLENQTRATPPLNIQLGYSSEAPVRFVTYGVCGNDPSQQKPVNPANPQFIISATDPKNCPVFLTDNENPPQTYTFTVTNAAAVHVNSDCRCQKKSRQLVKRQRPSHQIQHDQRHRLQRQYGPSQSSKAWCCTLLPGNGAGVFAYSTPEVPPTAHQTSDP